MEEDEFLTIEHERTAEIKVKGSRFIGTVHPITTEREAVDFIRTISQRFFNATHNCYAYQIGSHDAAISRYSDAGEPAGTAGLPILNVIHGRQLTNVAVVITRYFGGTKLGKGGLVRAYSECTQNVLDLCSIQKQYLYQKLSVVFDYNLTGKVMRLVSSSHAKILETIYDQDSRLILSLRKSKVTKFKSDLVEVTSGKILISELNQI